jgi:hypothetical protein
MSIMGIDAGRRLRLSIEKLCEAGRNRASRLALKPLRPCGFSAYQQYGHFCNNLHNFKNLKI